MEEDIKILEAYAYQIRDRKSFEYSFVDLQQAILNLIARNKELENKIKNYENIIETYIDKMDKIYKDSNYETLLKDFEKSGNHIPKI